jgi:MFS family permease
VQPAPPALRREPPQTSKLPGAIIALGFTSLFTDIGTEMIFPLLPAFVASLGAAPAFMGLVEGLADATSSLLKLASGYVAEGRSKKRLVLVGYGLASAVRPLVALAVAPWHVLAVRVTDRVGKGIRTAPRDALIADSIPKEQAGRAFGFHAAMDHAGAVLGPLLATALLALGWQVRSVFWFAFVPGLLAMLALLTVREPKPVAVANPASSSEKAPTLPGSLRRYFGILALFSLGNSSDAFLLLRAKDVGVKVVSIPLLWAVFNGVKVLSARYGGVWSDRMQRSKLIVIGWAVYAVTYVAFGVAHQPWQMWALFCVYGIYYGLTEPAEKAMVRDLAPAAARGRAYGLYNFIVGVSAIPAGLLTGWLWQTWSPRVALVSGALIALAASAALLFLRQGPRDTPAAGAPA